jgi:hypothetical protein
MNPGLTETCPLCEQTLPRARLHPHILTEEPSIRHGTIKKIKARFPGWTHEQGACPDCWDRHRSLVLTSSLEIFTGPEPNPAHDTKPARAKPAWLR